MLERSQVFGVAVITILYIDGGIMVLYLLNKCMVRGIPFLENKFSVAAIMTALTLICHELLIPTSHLGKFVHQESIQKHSEVLKHQAQQA